MKIFSKKISIVILSIMCIKMSSCVSLVATLGGLKKEAPELHELQVPNKQVYFLGMRHLANDKFYENAQKIIKEFQEKGFVFYVESVSDLTNEKRTIDTVAIKKFRKVTGINLGLKYSELIGSKSKALVTKYKLKDQPSYQSLGITNFRWVDYTISDLIKFYELRYKNVQLDSCDIETDIKSKYNCSTFNKTDRKIFTDEFILRLRNQLIVDNILNSTDSRIVIIYGQKHLTGIKNILENTIKK